MRTTFLLPILLIAVKIRADESPFQPESIEGSGEFCFDLIDNPFCVYLCVRFKKFDFFPAAQCLRSSKRLNFVLTNKEVAIDGSHLCNTQES